MYVVEFLFLHHCIKKVWRPFYVFSRVAKANFSFQNPTITFNSPEYHFIAKIEINRYIQRVQKYEFTGRKTR